MSERVTAEELAKVRERTSGPGPLAGDGDILRRLAADVERLTAELAEVTEERDTAEADCVQYARDLAAEKAARKAMREKARAVCDDAYPQSGTPAVSLVETSALDALRAEVEKP